MNLIDADKLKLELKWLECDRPVYHDVMSTIDEIATVDAVPVVRCKDCGYWDATQELCWHMLTDDENGYCSWGEREDD